MLANKLCCQMNYFCKGTSRWWPAGVVRIFSRNAASRIRSTSTRTPRTCSAPQSPVCRSRCCENQQMGCNGLCLHRWFFKRLSNVTCCPVYHRRVSLPQTASSGKYRCGTTSLPRVTLKARAVAVNKSPPNLPYNFACCT